MKERMFAQERSQAGISTGEKGRQRFNWKRALIGGSAVFLGGLGLTTILVAPLSPVIFIKNLALPAAALGVVSVWYGRKLGKQG